MTEKRQTSQGYIIRILQHFATKLWNITWKAFAQKNVIRISLLKADFQSSHEAPRSSLRVLDLIKMNCLAL
jgi:hypothetical protein